MTHDEHHAVMGKFDDIAKRQEAAMAMIREETQRYRGIIDAEEAGATRLEDEQLYISVWRYQGTVDAQMAGAALVTQRRKTTNPVIKEEIKRVVDRLNSKVQGAMGHRKKRFSSIITETDQTPLTKGDSSYVDG